MMLKNNVFLIGFMGCGKSTISKMLSEKLGLKMVDSDEYIENEQNMKISDMFKKYGEVDFRKCDTEFLAGLSSSEGYIVACGGGMAVNEKNVSLMKQKGTVIMLTATAETIFERVRRSTHRPLLNGNMNIDYIRKLMNERTPAYTNACDHMISTDNKSPFVIADEIIGVIVQP